MMYCYYLIKVHCASGLRTTVSLDPALAARAVKHFGGRRQLNKFVRSSLAGFDNSTKRSKAAAQAVQRALN